ncbi:DUF1566 domain-containing protein [Alteromonas sp. ASW11-36]|uniref:DUF1566 domain-containing protein n=1 Tax=Alteromonas arenosi TaxID=3055817 RepID=A0ABT7T0I0_9ALTE|nr:DUF1566 domain-containing protein [Alteromonas sp. ASW11-36]MDM7861935.1 DUF1566 domain-containing protein [Alteromonas sp. ASW11-36]
MRIKTIVLLLSGLCFSAGTMAQTCLANIPPTTPTNEFIELTTQQIKHQRTGLVWMRCAIGQTWDGNTCEGDAEQLTWQQALQVAHGYELESTLGWRVPNIKELATLTERQCVRPSINTSFFPDTPEDDFWTSTPSVSDPQRAWVVAFFNSSNSLKDKDRFVFVRLVRDALPNE